jgi:hypothetical protein
MTVNFSVPKSTMHGPLSNSAQNLANNIPVLWGTGPTKFKTKQKFQKELIRLLP